MSVKISFNLFGNNNNPEQQSLKGKSLLQVPNDYVTIDIETTGFDPYFCDVIEIAALQVEDGRVIREFQTLINPKCEIDDFISELTGITNAMVKDAPFIEDIIQNFYNFVGDSIIVGHNVNFDINFLFRSIYRHLEKPFSNNFVDTLRLSRWFFKNYENHKLLTVAKNLDVTVSMHHRALADCYTVKSIMDKIHLHVHENNIDLKQFFAKKYLNAKDITTDKTEFDEDHPLYDKNIVFTGTLEKMIRKDAMQLVANLGGHCQNGINKQANILIMGNNDYCTQIKDGKSQKQKKAEEYILKGQDLIIISENAFYDLALEN